VLQWERNAALTVLNRGRVPRTGGEAEPFIICTGCGLWFEDVPGTAAPTETQRSRLKFHDTICNNHHYETTVLSTFRRVDCLQVLPDLETLDIPASPATAVETVRRVVLDRPWRGRGGVTSTETRMWSGDPAPYLLLKITDGPPMKIIDRPSDQRKHTGGRHRD
jgi:hypothetical protein